MGNNCRIFVWSAIIFLTVSVRHYSVIIWSGALGHRTLHTSLKSSNASTSLSMLESTRANAPVLSTSSIKTPSDVEKFTFSNFNNSANTNKVSSNRRTVTTQEKPNVIICQGYVSCRAYQAKVFETCLFRIQH